MSRLCYLVLLAVVVSSEVGCCCARAPWPCGRMWYGCQCGELYWNEWFSHPPDCCDPCDRCARFNGNVLPVHYSQGTSDAPTVAEPPKRKYINEPTPAEELPPGRSSTGIYRNEFGQQVSYDEPVDSPRRTRTLDSLRRARYRGR
jgi:hypothetical protein